MLPSEIAHVALVGIGATLVLDAWAALLKQLGIPTLNVALVGRWTGYAVQGAFVHPSIAKSPPLRGEVVLGWFAHYAVGVAFAGLLYAAAGDDWLQRPSLTPAVIVGFATATVPLFVMQPAMGSGFAASKTAAPLKNCVRSVVNHGVFGIGLYVAAVVLRGI